MGNKTGLLLQGFALSAFYALATSMAFAHDDYAARWLKPDSTYGWVIAPEPECKDNPCAKDETQRFVASSYIGLLTGASHVAPEGVSSGGYVTQSTASNGYKLFGGRQFKPHWAWEVSYADLGAAGLFSLSSLPSAEISYKVPAAWLNYSPFHPNKKWGVTGKVGLAAISNKANSALVGFDAQTNVQVAFSVSAKWRINERFFLQANHDRYDKDARYTAFGVGFYFTEHNEHAAPAPQRIPEPAPEPIPEPLPVVEPEIVLLDTDNDGVIDEIDQCPTTPLGVNVDGDGCAIPVDLDQDGIPDAQDRCLNTPIGSEVDNTGCTIQPTVNCEAVTGVLSGLQFESASSALTSSAQQLLANVAADLRVNQDITVEIQAHTDSQGAADYNLRLSADRAKSVMQFLIQSGISVDRMQAIGYGETRPIADNETAAGRAANRRIELKTTNTVCQ